VVVAAVVAVVAVVVGHGEMGAQAPVGNVFDLLDGFTSHRCDDGGGKGTAEKMKTLGDDNEGMGGKYFRWRAEGIMKARLSVQEQGGREELLGNLVKVKVLGIA
jgi:hypothetical protein